MKQEGYSCDGTRRRLVLDMADTLAHHGWYCTYTPPGEPTLHTCSTRCLTAALTAPILPAVGA